MHSKQIVICKYQIWHKFKLDHGGHGETANSCIIIIFKQQTAGETANSQFILIPHHFVNSNGNIKCTFCNCQMVERKRRGMKQMLPLWKDKARKCEKIIVYSVFCMLYFVFCILYKARKCERE